MSAETITTAIFLITAVVATAVLVNAIYPVIYSTAGTFQSSTHDADTRLRTDFKIVATFGKSPNVQVWMKNIGSQSISLEEIKKADVFCGAVGNFGRLNYIDGIPDTGEWTEIFTSTTGDLNDNDYWDNGETLEINAKPTTMPSSGNLVYFQLVLSNGIWRSTEFTAS